MDGHGTASALAAGRRIPVVLRSLRRAYGARAPRYQTFWARIQDGTINAHREGACWAIDDDDTTVATALDLAKAGPRTDAA